MAPFHAAENAGAGEISTIAYLSGLACSVLVAGSMLTTRRRYGSLRSLGLHTRSSAKLLLSRVAGGVVLLAGCAGTITPAATSEPHIAWRLRGRVVPEGHPDATVVVVVQRFDRDREKWEPLDQMIVHGDAHFELLVDLGHTMRVAAFVDENANGTHEAREPASILDTIFDPVDDRDYGVRDGIVIHIRADSRLSSPLVLANAERRSLASGEVMSLGHVQFSSDSARLGVQDPLQWMRDYTAGLFFLTPYDPSREPVVLVHGLGGYGMQFETMVAAFEGTSYQPVIAAYPSGWPLSDVALYFDRLLGEFHDRYAPQEVHVVAHSMGGLIARDAIGLRAGRGEPPIVSTLTSIASPLGGHPMALAGVRYARNVVPAWRDLALPSAFLRDLFEDPLPPEIPYLLVYTPHDRSVPIESQCRRSAMREASWSVPVDATHVEVLSRPETVAAVLDHLVAPAPRRAPVSCGSPR